MRIGKRIRFFRKHRSMTQQELGEAVGFPTATAAIRVAQYETGERKPKAALRERFADALGVSAGALAVPPLDTEAGVMHTLFTLENLYGFQIAETGEGLVLRLQASLASGGIQNALAAWERQRLMMEAGILSKESYDEWRFQFHGS